MYDLRFAINMEVEGEGYYRHQAQKNRGNALHKVFSDLAEEEFRHAALLRDCEMGRPFTGGDLSSNVFDGLSDFNAETKASPEQADAYRLALDMEKKSIELYEKLRAETQGADEMFEFLIAQEKEHYRVFEEILKLVNRPNEWVESAEFGTREEY